MEPEKIVFPCDYPVKVIQLAELLGIERRIFGRFDAVLLDRFLCPVNHRSNGRSALFHGTDALHDMFDGFVDFVVRHRACPCRRGE